MWDTVDCHTNVYCIRNKVNGREYYGTTKKPKERTQKHFSELLSGKHHNFALQNDFDEYGIDAFEMDVLVVCSLTEEDREYCLYMEREFIKNDPSCYNFIGNSKSENSDFQMEIRKVIQAEGIAVAKAQGKHLGRPKTPITDEFVQAYTEWKEGKILGVEAIEKARLTKATYYRLVKQYEGGLEQ